MKSLISIIIPTYNRAHIITETLDSVISQTYTNWECIIIDDRSTDNTKEIIDNYLKKDERISFIVKSDNQKKGASTSRNIGLSLAKGDYIQFLDSDDVIANNKLEEQLKVISNEPTRAVVTCKWGVFEKSNKSATIFHENFLYKNFYDIRDYFELVGEYGGFLPLHCFLIDKKIIDKVGSWNEDLSVNDDGEFIFRVLTNGASVFYCSNTHVLYRKSKDETLSSINSVEKADSLIRSWLIIENHYYSYFGMGEAKYLNKKKEQIYNSLKKLHPILIKKNKSFFKNQVKNDHDKYNVKYLLRKVMNKIKYYFRKSTNN